MKKLAMFLMLFLAMAIGSHRVFAQSVTVVLMPGWNWISVPLMDTLDFETAMGSVTPVEGDIIKSKWGAATYTGDGQWRGTISQFYPGYGYHYKSNRMMPVMVTFNTQYPDSQVIVTTVEPTDITAMSTVVGGIVTLPEGSHVFLCGVCWGMEPNPDVDGNHTSESMEIGSFSSALEGLDPNATYYVRAYAVTDYGLVYGNSISFTTLSGIPTVSTAVVTNILGDGAICGGMVTDDGGLEIIARGVCWSMNHNPTLSNNYTTDGTGTGSFSSTLTGLITNSTYYVRAYATTAQATSYGEEMTFTTLNGIPAVSTAEVTNILGDGATCGGVVTNDGGLTIIARGVCWSTGHYPTLNNSYTTDSTGMGSFNSTLTGLTPNTTYYVRAYVTNSYVTVYGSEQSFTTLNGIPEVSTAPVSNIQSSSATCGGTVTSNGGLNVTAKGVCWNTSPNPTINNSHTNDGNGMGSFSSTLIDLVPGTIYYVRAYATNSYTTSYGDEISFTSSNQIWANGVLPELFRVSSSQRVYFSQGNLQYKASTSTWRFAEHQYDYVGNANNNISQNYDGWIDLFGWGTSGWNNGNTYYHPWDSQNNGNSNQGYGYGPTNGTSYQYNLNDLFYSHADWGVHNAISNGFNSAGKWRTLTDDEWYYVFNTRSTSSGIRYAKAKVNNVNGVILLPDNWSSSYYTLNNTNTNNASFSSNVITATAWSTLEQHGAVFLPASGFRNGTSVSNVGSEGLYWSASYFTAGTGLAFHMSFYDGYLYSSGSGSARYYGYSVRLVRNQY